MANGSRASYSDTFEHAFDAKGRITVPAEWRLDSFEKQLFIVRAAGKCLRVYPESWMASLQEQIAPLKDSDPMRKQVQLLAAGAQSATWDQQGRIMVKERLRSAAGLQKEAVLAGFLTHFEIWDKAAWDEQQTGALTVEEALSAIGR